MFNFQVASSKHPSEGLESIITPAELPSERARFADKLGRESVLSAREDEESGVDDEHPTDEVPVLPWHPALLLAVEPDPPTLAIQTEDPARSTAPPGPSSTAPPAMAPLATTIASEVPLEETAGTRQPAVQQGSPPVATGKGAADAIVVPTPTSAAPPAPADVAAPSLEPIILPVETGVQPGHDSQSIGHLEPEVMPDSGASGVERVEPIAPLASSETPVPKPLLPTTQLQERASLSSLPATLERHLEHALRLRGDGDRWQVEIKLDPPDLGAIRIRFELSGGSLRGTIQYEDPRLQEALERLLPELEERLRRDGQGASFDLLPRRGKDSEPGSGASSSGPGPEQEAPIHDSPRRRSTSHVLDLIA